MSDAITNAISVAKGTAVSVTSKVTAATTVPTLPTDAISSAIASATSTVSDVTSNAAAALDTAQNVANTLVTSANSAIANAQATAVAAQAKAQAAIDKANMMKDKLSKLPLDKDPELIKQQLEADILKKKADLEQKILFYKENAIEQLMGKLNSLKIPSLPIPIKLPIIDPKILGWRAALTQIKDVIKQRNKMSVANLEKGVELYKYPLKNVSKLNVPKIPQVPKVPDLPRLPTIPKINV